MNSWSIDSDLLVNYLPNKLVILRSDSFSNRIVSLEQYAGALMRSTKFLLSEVSTASVSLKRAKYLSITSTSP